MKKIFYLFVCLLIVNCGGVEQKKSEQQATRLETESDVEKLEKIGRLNFAVVWKWNTNDEKLVSDNFKQIAGEMTKLWENGNAENFYYNAKSRTDKFLYFPNIVFTLKAKNINEAKNILNELSIVKKEIATYRLFPVGQLWLERNEEAIKNNDVSKTYVAVWNNKNNNPTNELVQSQTNQVMELWNSGKIENVYFDIEGTQEENEVTDFVFFVNANTKVEANEICSLLPFAKEKISTFTLHEVGHFFLGTIK